jgi:hypothetical protein
MNRLDSLPSVRRANLPVFGAHAAQALFELGMSAVEPVRQAALERAQVLVEVWRERFKGVRRLGKRRREALGLVEEEASVRPP